MPFIEGAFYPFRNESATSKSNWVWQWGSGWGVSISVGGPGKRPERNSMICRLEIRRMVALADERDHLPIRLLSERGTMSLTNPLKWYPCRSMSELSAKICEHFDQRRARYETKYVGRNRAGPPGRAGPSLSRHQLHSPKRC